MVLCPDPELNAIKITHAELRALQEAMRAAIADCTQRYCLDGPRLLDRSRGEFYKLKAHKRDRQGLLLASVVVHLPWCHQRYTRRVRLVSRGLD